MSRLRGRPFEKGNRMGRGRPKGSGNKLKRPEQALLREYAPHLTRKCIAMAMQGSVPALRLCMERVYPALQDGHINLNLSARRTQDLGKAAEKVTREVTRGRLTPSEGGKVMSILEGRGRIVENTELQNRLGDLEQKMTEEWRRTG
jgi:hypothetical protein